MKDVILKTAIDLAMRKGLAALTRDGVAVAAKVAAGSVTYHYKDFRKLCTAVVQAAIDTNNLTLLGQALAAKHPLAMKLSDATKRAAMANLTAQLVRK